MTILASILYFGLGMGRREVEGAELYRNADEADFLRIPTYKVKGNVLICSAYLSDFMIEEIAHELSSNKEITGIKFECKDYFLLY